jgi:hypothetical protein
MPPGSDKWIRSLRENEAGKVVAEGERNRWEWQSDDDTARLLKKLTNDELSIEKTDIRPTLSSSRTTAARAPTAAKQQSRPLKPSRDAAGGFNPYDHGGKPKRR